MSKESFRAGRKGRGEKGGGNAIHKPPKDYIIAHDQSSKLVGIILINYIKSAR